MKKTVRRLSAIFAAFVMLLSLVGVMPAKSVKADDTYKLFLAYGGGSNWEHQYYGEGASKNTATVKGTEAEIAVGGTATISVEIPDGSDKTWFAAPCLIIPGKAASATIDYEIISCKVDGKDVAIDFTQGDAYWTEDTGDYTADDCIRLAGGCNEWAANYITQPANFKTYEYTIKLNSVDFPAPAATGVEELAGPFEMFLAYGGGNDWEHGYTGVDTETVKGTTAQAKPGDTVTIGINIENGSNKTWYAAPCIIVPGHAADAKVDFEIVSCKVDGQEVAVDLTKGDDLFWAEGTGDYTADDCIRLAGGCNEWAANFITQPADFKTYEYTIKLNKVYVEKASTSAPQELTGPFDAFLAYGGGNDWEHGYTGVDTETVKGTTAKVNPGDTFTIGVNIENGSNKTWYAAPCILVPGMAEEAIADYEIISIKVDGQEVTADLSLGDPYWAETTGDYNKTDCLRLAGGCNEWGVNYITQPVDFKILEYTIKLNSIKIPGKEVQTSESKDVYEVGIAVGGDITSGDWANSYVTGYNENITAETAYIKSGETAHVSLTFKNPVLYTWYIAPYMINSDESKDITTISNIDITINSIKFDGVEVTPDMTQGDAWWKEGTGDYDADHSIRLGGGYNEWGAHYITCPANYSKVEFDITFNKIEVTEEVVPEFDESLLTNDYNAYLIFQCPDTWVYRDDWTNETSGLLGYNDGVSDYFTHVTWNDGATEEEKNLGGTVTDAVIDGNGTYTVSIEGAEPGLHGSTKWNMLYVSTTIPYSCLELGGVQITDAVLKIDGKKVGIDALITKGDEVKSKTHPEVNGVYTGIQFINTYNKENPNALDSAPIPQKSISITFTVSGLGKDSPTGGNVVTNEPEPTPTPAPTATPVPEATKAPTEAPKATDTPAPTATTAPTEAATVTPAAEQPTESGSNVGIIIGVIAAVVVLAGVAVFFVLKGKKKQ